MPQGPSPGTPPATVGTRSISVVGTGYVGLVTALAFAHHGHHVTCVDILPDRIDAISRGDAPFYEPGVGEALAYQLDAGRLTATTDTRGAVEGTDVTFLCVGTPTTEDGSYDLSQLVSATRDVGLALRSLDRRHYVVTKSTVTPTTNRTIVLPTLEETAGRSAPDGFSLLSNPEFLREGSALQDALSPDRVVIGLMEGDDRAKDLLMDLYRPFGSPVLLTSLEGAELVKLASNSLLAIKVAFANEVANVAAAVGADGYQVLEGVGMDHRLGPHFLRAGAGFGGSCFPKDLQALVAFARSLDLPTLLPMAALEQNEVQPRVVVAMARMALDGVVAGKRVTLLGLAFKPDTDDVRETRALPIYRTLTEWGAEVTCHDPRAGGAFAELVSRAGLPSPKVEDDLDEALRDADLALVQTEWDEYRALAPARLRSLMARPCILDARRALDPIAMVEGGVTYLGVGYPTEFTPGRGP